MRKWAFIFTAAVFMGAGLVQAADEPEKVADMVVTATRSELPKDKIGGSAVTVITAEDIAAKKLNSVADLLRSVPGLEIRAYSGPGSATTASIRGADSKNTLVLIDGIMLNDPSSPNRGADLAHLTPDNIERIEVVRGPMSALYGTNATAGVINIITKKGSTAPTAFATAEGGSYNTWKLAAGAAGAVKKFNFSLAAAQTETDGFSSADADNDRIPHAGNTSENDGYKNTTLSGKFGLDITPDFDINATVRLIDSEVEIDDSSGNGYAGDRFAGFFGPPQPNGLKEARNETEQLFYKFDVHNFFFDRKLESKFYYQNSGQEREIYNNDGARTNAYDGKSYEYGWQGGFNLHESFLFTVGASYFEEAFDTDTSPEKDADTTSLWGQGQWFYGDSFIFSGELRSDDHKAFGQEITYRIAPSYEIPRTGTTLKASYGTGFRAPSLFELYADPVPAWGFLGGNQTLNPETSVGWDAGFEQPLLDHEVKLGATYFSTDYDDRIIYTGAWPAQTYQNDLGVTRTKGVEAFVQWMPLAVVDFTLNYTYTSAHDPNDDRLAYIPLNKVTFNTKYRPTEKLHLNLDAYWVDERDTKTFDKDKNGNPAGALEAYSLVNVSGSYDINQHLQVFGRVDNVFDEYYEALWSYATAGLSAYAGIKVTY